MTISGNDLAGVKQDQRVRVCEVGPFLVMKLRALGSRQEGKDAFDILYTLLHYDRGTAAAIAGFIAETQAHNSACPDALRCLEMHFGSEDALAPKKAAEFFPGPSSAREPPGVREQR